MPNGYEQTGTDPEQYNKKSGDVPTPYADPRYNKVPTPMTQENSDAYASSMNRTWSRPRPKY